MAFERKVRQFDTEAERASYVQGHNDALEWIVEALRRCGDASDAGPIGDIVRVALHGAAKGLEGERIA